MPSLKLTQFGGIAPRQRPNNLHQAMAQVVRYALGEPIKRSAIKQVNLFLSITAAI